MILGGVVAGLLQWLMRRRHVTRAGWWVLASTVGWALGGPAIVDADASWAVLGAVYEVIPGAVLVRLRQPVPAAGAEE